MELLDLLGGGNTGPAYISCVPIKTEHVKLAFLLVRAG
jgi:hypothetical protein